MLFSRADFDLATKYLSAYSAQLVDSAMQEGFNVTDLYRNDASSLNFGKFIGQNNIFLGFGHGTKTTFTGQNLEMLLDAKVNPQLMAEKKCYLASCQTGLSLGPKLIDNNCIQYFGYQADWVFVYNMDYENSPLRDPYAQPFFDCALMPAYGILAGLPTKEIYNATMERHEYWWDYWKKQDDPVGDSIITWLNWNKENFIAMGGEDETYTEKASLEDYVIPVGAGISLVLLALLKK